MRWLEIPGTRVRTPSERFNDLVVAGEWRFAVASDGDFIAWDSANATIQRRDLGFGHARSVGFEASGRVGWIGLFVGSGSGPRLLKTIDCGRNWEPVPEESLPEHPREGICGIEVLDDKTAFACGTFKNAKRPGLWKTTNGSDWTEIKIAAEARGLTDVRFWDPNQGLIAGARDLGDDMRGPLLHYTIDGGASWAEAALPDDLPKDSYLWKVHFIDRMTGFASVAAVTGGRGFVLKTCDGGKSWVSISIDGPESADSEGAEIWDLQGVGFASERLGWACSRRDFAYETRDGGESWTRDAVLSDVNRFVVMNDGVLASGDALYWRPL